MKEQIPCHTSIRQGYLHEYRSYGGLKLKHYNIFLK